MPQAPGSVGAEAQLTVTPLGRGLITRLTFWRWRPRRRQLDARTGYDLWSATYDDEPDNLLIVFDEQVFGNLMARVDLREKVVVDVGCGTGRHWAKMEAQHPDRLLGFDSSAGMLARLRAKHPQAVLQRVDDHRLPGVPDGSCDVVVSTLALGHFSDLDAVLAEWARILKPGGDIVVTDFHPQAAAHGACTFRHQGQEIAIKVHVHTLDAIAEAAARMQLAVLHTEEKLVDESSRRFFEERNASASFARMRNIPLVYGLHLRKNA